MDKKQKPENVRVVEGKEVLRHDLSESDQSKMGLEIARKLQVVSQLDREMKTDAKEYKARISAIEDEVDKMVGELNAGHVLKETPVDRIWDYDNGIAMMVRKDTRAVVWERPLRADEQPTLEGTIPPHDAGPPEDEPPYHVGCEHNEGTCDPDECAECEHGPYGGEPEMPDEPTEPREGAREFDPSMVEEELAEIEAEKNEND